MIKKEEVKWISNRIRVIITTISFYTSRFRLEKDSLTDVSKDDFNRWPYDKS